jgi:hypothetical protein
MFCFFYMTIYEAYLVLLLTAKLWFLITLVMNRLVPSEKWAEQKERAETVFQLMMALLLIFLFRPSRPTPVRIERETKLLLFALGVVLVASFVNNLIPQ